MKNAVLLVAILLCYYNLYANLIYVSNSADITSAMNSAVPGDSLIMTTGVWQNQTILFGGANGTLTKPIVLMAENPGSTSLEGNSRLKIYGNYLVVYGLLFKNPDPAAIGTNPIIEFRNGSTLANHSRLSNTYIYFYNSDNAIDNKWVSIYGTYNEVDHCRFEGKSNYGPTMVVWYVNVGGFPNESPSTYHLVHHNYFLNRTLPGGGNGGETIRVGDSQTSRTNGYNIFEFNLFEQCDGEIEIISNKSEFNTYRYNTFRKNNGQLCLRHGANCTIHNNFFLGENYAGSSGIRIIDGNHTIYNNYFQDLKGGSSSNLRSPITIMNADASPAPNGYWPVYNTKIYNNSFVNCASPSINIGAQGGTVVPTTCTFINNLLSGNSGPFIKYESTPTQFKYLRNIYFGTTLGINNLNWLNYNPDLVYDNAEKLYRLSSTSLAIDSGLVLPFTIDFDCQNRIDSFDIGADEYTNLLIKLKPQEPENVNPCWLKSVPDCPIINSILLALDDLKLELDCKKNYISMILVNNSKNINGFIEKWNGIGWNSKHNFTLNSNQEIIEFRDESIFNSKTNIYRIQSQEINSSKIEISKPFTIDCNYEIPVFSFIKLGSSLEIKSLDGLLSEVFVFDIDGRLLFQQKEIIKSYYLLDLSTFNHHKILVIKTNDLFERSYYKIVPAF